MIFTATIGQVLILVLTIAVYRRFRSRSGFALMVLGQVGWLGWRVADTGAKWSPEPKLLLLVAEATDMLGWWFFLLGLLLHLSRLGILHDSKAYLPTRVQAARDAEVDASWTDLPRKVQTPAEPKKQEHDE